MPPKLPRPLREPTLHFFLIAGAVLLGQKLLAEDANTIAITPALKADLLRRYRDQLNRPPTSAEAEAFLTTWKMEEALYREALREGIDRDDPTVRAVMIGKMRERVLLERRLPEPTQADLDRYLDEHRAELEAPLIYEHEVVTFAKTATSAAEERAEAARKLEGGGTPAALGLRSTVANVDRARIEKDLGADVAAKVVGLPPGKWHALETTDRLFLIRMIRVHGGLPEPQELRRRLVAGFKGAAEEKALAAATRAIAERYRFEETAE